MIVETFHSPPPGAESGGGALLAWVAGLVGAGRKGNGHMAGQETGTVREAGEVGAGRGAPREVYPGGAPFLALDRALAVGRAAQVREAGEQVGGGAGDLVAALEEAASAASGMAAALPEGLISGPALAECAALLARRARDFAAESDRVAHRMRRSAGFLVAADEEVARHVADAAG